MNPSQPKCEQEYTSGNEKITRRKSEKPAPHMLDFIQEKNYSFPIAHPNPSDTEINTMVPLSHNLFATV